MVRAYLSADAPLDGAEVIPGRSLVTVLKGDCGAGTIALGVVYLDCRASREEYCKLLCTLAAYQRKLGLLFLWGVDWHREPPQVLALMGPAAQLETWYDKDLPTCITQGGESQRMYDFFMASRSSGHALSVVENQLPAGLATHRAARISFRGHTTPSWVEVARRFPSPPAERPLGPPQRPPD